MSVSGYTLENNYFKTSILYDRKDEGVADILSGVNNYLWESGISGYGIQSGQVLGYSEGSSGDSIKSFIFLNGIKLINEIDYKYISGSGGWLKATDNTFSGVTGIISVSLISGESDNLEIVGSTLSYQNSIENNIKDASSLVFYNRLRQKLNIDYIETSSLDIVYGLTGFYETNLNSIINL